MPKGAPSSIPTYTSTSTSTSSGDQPRYMMMDSSDGRRRRRRLRRILGRLLPHPPPSSGSLPFLRNFTNKEIKLATAQLSNIIGTDPRGNLLKASFSDGQIAAVRELKCSQSVETFYRYVQLLGRIHHRHLLNLRGFSEGRDRFLVFDYMENGSLKDYLHDPLRTPLDWGTRLKMVISIAAAMEYLQFFCSPPVSNFSICSSNVLLDDDLVPKLCNFGGNVSDEEDTSSGGLVRRSDVIFQFGVLILELVTGQSFETGGSDLIQWIQKSGGFADSMHEKVDDDLGNNYDYRELRSLLNVARWCTQTGGRPASSIRQILRYLQKKPDFRST